MLGANPLSPSGLQRRGSGGPLMSPSGSPTKLIKSNFPRRFLVPQAGVTPPDKQTVPGKVICLGEALFDLIADQAGVPREKVNTWTPFAGGAPCNVATCLGKLGADVVFVSALGKDDRGEQLMQLLEASGVKLDAVQRRDEPTRDVYVVRDNKGDREFAGFGLSTDQYCDCFIDPELLPYDEIKKASILVTGTLGLAYPKTREAIKRAAAAAHEGNCQVFVDVNWRPVFWKDHAEAKREINDYLQQADLIKLSDTDLEWLLGIDFQSVKKNPCSVLEHYPRAKGVLVTAGESGAAYCFRSSKAQHSGMAPVFKVDVIETTGAGDAFTAGFVYKMLQAGGLGRLSADAQALKEAVVFACAVGALTTTGKGAIEAQPTLKASEQLFESSKTDWQDYWSEKATMLQVEA